MTPRAEGLPSVANTAHTGAVLRAARQAAGLSLGALANRTHYSKPYLSRVESGQRRATHEIVAAYEQALTEDNDVRRRDLLTGLLAGVVAPNATAPAVTAAFEQALAGPRPTVDDWLAKVEGYGHDYMSHGAGEMQARLSSDLVAIRHRLDDPQVCSAAARLLMVHGKTTPTATRDSESLGGLHWYRLAARTADRSDDTDTRVWTRGRAALALAYEGAELPAAKELALQALAIDDAPTLGRLNALLGLAHVQALNGDTKAALETYDAARRVFDRAGSDDDDISDFAIPQWRMATISSLLLARLGEERLAVDAQETADRTRPDTLPRFATHIELHRGLLLARSGDHAGGVTYAIDALAKLPPERHSLSLRLMLAEIEAVGGLTSGTTG